MPSVFGVPRAMKSEQEDHGRVDTPPPGSTAPTPKLFARVVFGLGRVLATLAAGGLVLKGIGEVVSDRYGWSQWLEWTPNILVATGALVSLVTSSVLAKFASAAARPARFSRCSGWVARVAWLLWAAHAAYTVVVDAPFYRSRPSSPGAIEDSLRVVFWNAGAAERPGWEDAVVNAAPDLVVLVGLSSREPLPRILEQMSGGSRLVYDRFTILSTLPLRRFGFAHLNIPAGKGYDPRLPEGVHAGVDPGAAMYLEVEGRRERQETFTVWVVDLPSDISLLREVVAQKARAAIDAFDGQRLVRTAEDNWSIEPGTGFTGRPGFPTPDLVIGDFNIPRGASSLAHLDNGYPDAFEQAARGYTASWPRRLPMWHLDQAFIGPRLRAWRYEMRDTGSGAHLMQVLDVTPR